MLHQQLKNLFASPHFSELKVEALAANEWFTAASIETAVAAILSALPEAEPAVVANGRRVGVVCAGNIPLVGFWDMYSAVVSGATVIIKPSRRDPLMMLFKDLVEVVEQLPSQLDTVVAMGSDATMAALKAQFPTSKLILRGSEASFALLTGEERADDIEKLGDDLFTHSGMGCRSVVHLFLPEGYDFNQLVFNKKRTFSEAWTENVRYERARRTLVQEKVEDKDFFILSINTFGTPLRAGVVGYSHYKDKESLEINFDKVKCYTALQPLKCIEKHVPFGTAQHPTFDQVFEPL